MNAIQENKVSRNFKVITFFNDHLATLSPGVAYLTTAVNNFIAKQDELSTYDMQATESTIGYTMQKAAYRTQLRDETLRIAGALKAQAIVINDKVGIYNYSLTKSQLDSARDTDILHIADTIAIAAAAVGAAVLVPFGVNGALITNLAATVTQFKTYIQRPKNEKFEGKSAGEMVDACLTELDEQLVLIDALMLTQKEDFPQLYLQYLGDRSIDDDLGGSSPTPADYVVVLQPNVFTEIVNMPYNPFQRFRAKNNGTANVNWSLSINNISFSTPPTVLNAGEESNYQSDSLAPSGNVLLFLNPSPTPITVEVWVVDL